jgi:uncharacterized protein YjlB
MPKHLLYFKDDGDIPNHPRWPLLLYSRALDLETLTRSETAFDELFAKNDWIVRFRAGIYSFIHYHSNAHEVLGVARGHATVQFGGEAGQAVGVQAGDAVLLPAGTGHQLIAGSADLLVVGAYPPGPDRDLMRAGEVDRNGVRARIASVAKPNTDPIRGLDGPMIGAWN